MPFPPFGPPRRNGGRAVLTIVLLIFLGLSILLNLILLIVAASGSSSSTQTVITNGSSDQRIAVIPITGVIDDHQVERFFRFMHRAEEDKGVKALILQVDSPGGSVTASDEIYARILRYKQKKQEGGQTIPVVISMRELAASGGYYISCAGDYLFAERTTLTGNIGVLWPNYNIAKMLDKIGVEDDTIVSTGTPYKYAGAPFRAPTTRESDYFQHNVDVAFQQFKDVVKAGRAAHLPKDMKVEDVADGRAFPAGDALSKGLIDQLGYLEDAEQYAATTAGLKNPEIVKYQEPPTLLSIFSSDSESRFSGKGVTIHLDASALDRLGSPQVMYLYRPSPPSLAGR